ncbi:MAG: hypothetical protein KDC28_05815 [Saprospiraceae bacterium]|nr:hypothetical protein [Saprospiraceae bacterium]MCB9322000.1 hypothetical protein [Lewinellaceae bacterium]
MADLSNMTIGDVVPADLKGQFSANVLNTTIKVARDIVKFDMPPPSNLSASDVAELEKLYSMYQDNQNKAYWHKSEAENEAYWNKNS